MCIAYRHRATEYLLVVDIEVNVKQVPEAEQRSKHERVNQFLRLRGLSSALGHRRGTSLNSTRFAPSSGQRGRNPAVLAQFRRGGVGIQRAANRAQLPCSGGAIGRGETQLKRRRTRRRERNRIEAVDG